MKKKYFALIIAALLMTGCAEKKNPEDVNVFMARGESYLDEGNYDKAVESFKKAVFLQPNLAVAHEKLALIYDGVYGDVETAQHHYTLSLELEENPDKREQLIRWLEGLEGKEWANRLENERYMVTPAAPEELDAERLREIEGMRTWLIDKEKIIAEQQAKISALTTEIETHTTAINPLKEQLANERKKQEELVAELQVAGDAQKSREQEIAQLTEETARLTEDLNKSQEANIELQTRLDEALREMVATSTRRGLRKRYDEIVKKYNKLYSICQTYKDRLAKVMKENKTHQREIARLKKLISTPATAKYTYYTVQQGDTLRKIAREKLGDEKKWELIYEINKDQIPNVNEIKLGSVFKIPAY